MGVWQTVTVVARIFFAGAGSAERKLCAMLLCRPPEARVEILLTTSLFFFSFRFSFPVHDVENTIQKLRLLEVPAESLSRFSRVVIEG